MWKCSGKYRTYYCEVIRLPPTPCLFREKEKRRIISELWDITKSQSYTRPHAYFPSNFLSRSEISYFLVLFRNNQDERDDIFPFFSQMCIWTDNFLASSKINKWIMF